MSQGHAPEVVAAVLASGESASGVLCDACGAARAQEELSARAELPCRRCGSLLLGFRVFAKPPTRRVSGGTQRYAGVLRPPEDSNDTTSAYGVVLPTPGPAPCAAFDALLEADTTNLVNRASLGDSDSSAEDVTLLAPAPAAPGFASQAELAQLASVDPNDEGGETRVDPGAVARLRAERGLAPGAPLQAEISSGTRVAGPAGAAPPPPASAAPPRRALWPLCLILLLLIAISGLGLYQLLQD